MQLRGHELGHRGVDRIEFAPLEEIDALVGEYPRHGRARLQVREDELRVLEIGDGLAERLAFGGVVHRPFDDGLCHGR